MRMTLVVGAMCLVGCSNSSSGSGSKQVQSAALGCSDISGNWEVTTTSSESDCELSSGASNSNDKFNVTIRKVDGAWSVVLPAISGSCPGDLDPDTCGFIANCDVKNGTQLMFSYGVDWKFNGQEFSGSAIGRALPPLVKKSCTTSDQHSGRHL